MSERLPLEGVRVIDMTHRLAGPTLSMFLADWGADIIKVEWWQRMDAWRGFISVDHDKSGKQLWEARGNWLKLNRNKRDITLNLKHPKGKELFLRLVEKADVVADNFSANTMESLGVGYDVLSKVNPRIIMASLPGFGDWGPHKDFVGNGATIQSYAGLASITGYEDGIPRSSVNTWPDPLSGITGAIAIAMALFWREKSGRGQRIEMAQAEAVLALIGEAVLDYTVNGRVQTPAGNSDPVMAPHGCYPCKGDDAWITIAVGADREWQALCRVAAHPDWATDPRFADQLSRWKARKELDTLIERWTKSEDKWALSEKLQAAGVAATPVSLQDEFGEERRVPSVDFYTELEHPYVKRYPTAGARLDGRELPIRRLPPKLGEHNEQVYAELLGLTRADIDALRKEGVV